MKPVDRGVRRRHALSTSGGHGPEGGFDGNIRRVLDRPAKLGRLPASIALGSAENNVILGGSDLGATSGTGAGAGGGVVATGIFFLHAVAYNRNVTLASAMQTRSC